VPDSSRGEGGKTCLTPTEGGGREQEAHQSGGRGELLKGKPLRKEKSGGAIIPDGWGERGGRGPFLLVTTKRVGERFPWERGGEKEKTIFSQLVVLGGGKLEAKNDCVYRGAYVMGERGEHRKYREKRRKKFLQAFFLVSAEGDSRSCDNVSEKGGERH